MTLSREKREKGKKKRSFLGGGGVHKFYFGLAFRGKEKRGGGKKKLTFLRRTKKEKRKKVYTGEGKRGSSCDHVGCK